MSTPGISSAGLRPSPLAQLFSLASGWYQMGMPPLDQFQAFLNRASANPNLGPGVGPFCAQQASQPQPTTVHVGPDGTVATNGPDGPSCYRAMKDMHEHMLERHGPNDPRVTGLRDAIANWKGRKE